MRNISTKEHLSIAKKVTHNVDSAIFKRIRAHRNILFLSPDDRQRILNICRETIKQELHPALQKKETNLYAFHSLDKLKLIILVSIYENDVILGCGFRSGASFYDSLVQSSLKALEIASNNHFIKYHTLHIRVNVLFNEKIIDNQSIDSIKNNIILGLDSLIIQHDNLVSLLKNSVAVNYGLTLEFFLENLAKKINLNLKDVTLNKTKMIKYDSLEFREDYLTSNNRYGLYDLYRGNPLLLQSEVTFNKLLHSIKLAYSFFKKFFKQSSDISYFYDINNKKWIYKETHPAFLRKIASIWILHKAAKFMNDEEGVYLAKNAVETIIKLHFKKKDNMGFLNFSGLTDIGTAGFLLLALNSVDQIYYQDKIDQVSDFIIQSYDKKNKKFRPIFLFPPFTANYSTEAEYYLPHIAVTALNSIPAKSSKVINLAYDSFSYYRNLYLNSSNGFKMITWSTSSYTDIFLETKDILFSSFIFEMNDRILKNQIDVNHEQIDLIGSFSIVGNSQVTASITESLINAYKTAQASDDKNRQFIYKKAILRSLRFILQSQYVEDNTFNSEILGGFKNNLFENYIRIDNLQHNLHALMNSVKLFY